MNLDIVDDRSLFEKIMNHFGWYKTKMCDVKIDRLDVDYHFVVELPKEHENAINKEQVAESSRQEHRSRNQSRKTSKTSSSNSVKRTTRSQKEERK
jgi:hypothetical protein